MVMIDTKYDVIVAGGGPAGIAASIAAARNGASTLLVEANGYLGGHLPGFAILHGFYNQRGERVVNGIPFELVERVRSMGRAYRRVAMTHPAMPATVAVDPELAQYVAMELVLESGVDLLLHTVVTDTVMEKTSVRGVKIFNKSGHRTLFADVVVDATGDGDVAFRAGARFEKGRSPDGLLQPITLIFGMAGVDAEKIVAAMGGLPVGRCADPMPGEEPGAVCWYDANLSRWAQEAEAVGLLPHVEDKGSIAFSGYSTRPGEMTINATFINGLDPTVAEDLTRAHIECRRQVVQLSSFFIEHVPGFGDAHLVWTAPGLFIRDSRRFIGGYYLTHEDLLSDATFDDAVARAGYLSSVHNPEAKGGLSLLDVGRTGRGMDVPYRTLVPADIDGLILAGRCISGSIEAMASVRSVGSVMAIGQAAGTAAALAHQLGVDPRELDVEVLQDRLLSQGVDLGERPAIAVG